jgi:hypothetical protein
VIAAPTDFSSAVALRWTDFWPSAEGRKTSQSALHEMSGWRSTAAPLLHWTATTPSITLIFWCIEKCMAGVGEHCQQRAKR